MNGNITFEREWLTESADSAANAVVMLFWWRYGGRVGSHDSLLMR